MTELALSLLVLTYLIGGGVSAYQALCGKRRRPMQRLYWGACSLALWLGIAGAFHVLLYPPERFDQDGHLLGEMPPEFGLALLVATLGLCGTLIGLAIQWCLRR